MTTTDRLRRRRCLAAAAAATAAALLLASCGGSDGGSDGGPGGGPGGGPDGGGDLGGASEPADVRPDGPRPDVTADLRVVPGDDTVAVGYTVTNDGAVPLLLANRLPSVTGASSGFDDTLAYVTGAGASSVEISQRVFPWPGDDVERAQAPPLGATLLEPGATVTVDLEVPLPLTRNQPFGDDLGAGAIALPKPVEQVSFCLGVLPRDVTSATADQDGVVVLSHGNAAAEAQYLLCSDPVDLA